MMLKGPVVLHNRGRLLDSRLSPSPGADYAATATTSASAAMTATIAMKVAASKSDMSRITAS